MDPLLDYYLCTKDGETTMVACHGWEDDALDEYDSVQWLPYWRAVQLIVALMESDQAPVRLPDLFPLAALMEATEERIEELLATDDQ